MSFKRSNKEMNKQEKLEKQPINSLVFSLAAPSIVSLLMNSINIAIDRIFIGIGVGTVGITAVTVAFGIYLMIQGLSQLVSGGAASTVALKLGKKNIEDAEKVIGNTVILSLMLSLFISIMGYICMNPIIKLYGGSGQVFNDAREYASVLILGCVCFVYAQSLNSIIRGMGNAKAAMINFLIDIFLNIVMDAIFIFVFHMGVFGAALATTLSSGVCAVIAFIQLCSTKNPAKIKPKYFKLEKNIVKTIVFIGIPSCITQIAMSVVALVFNRACLKYGGETGVAAYGIVTAVCLLINMPIVGLALGIQPIIGYNYGAHAIDRVKETLKVGFKAGTLFVTAAFLIVELFAGQIVNIFGSSDDLELYHLATKALRLSQIMLPILAIQVIGTFFFQYIGEAKKSILLSALRQIIVLIPLILLLPIKFGMNGIFISQSVSDLISGTIIIRFIMKEIKLLNKVEENKNVEEIENTEESENIVENKNSENVII
ncbi:MATE family efflux transporter [Lachnotalea glycerini]|uniref:Multidrug export protein MepA n=2 Tax=Lachnotalea glycerini TaxID=1763509 RepID=A0A371JK13_9FIRM|nr:MATE family efflux transporter [Lachnotalea glycerini]